MVDVCLHSARHLITPKLLQKRRRIDGVQPGRQLRLYQHPDLVGPLVIVDTLPFLAGGQMQAKNLEDARASIAAFGRIP